MLTGLDCFYCSTQKKYCVSSIVLSAFSIFEVTAGINFTQFHPMLNTLANIRAARAEMHLQVRPLGADILLIWRFHNPIATAC